LDGSVQDYAVITAMSMRLKRMAGNDALDWQQDIYPSPQGLSLYLQ
jgi:hypothetical protein